MERRGQATIFIIVAIIFLVIVILFFFVKEKYYGTIENIPPEISEEVGTFYNSLNKCFEDKIYESLYEIGQFGGYSSVPSNSIDIGIPIYLENKTKRIHSLKNIEIETSNLVKKNINKCDLSLDGFEVKLGNPDVEVFISKDVSVKIINALTISKGERSYQIKEFPDVVVPFNLGLMYNVASEIVDEQWQNRESRCLSCLSDLAERRGVNINSLEYDDSTFLYSISEARQIRNKTYELVFALK